MYGHANLLASPCFCGRPGVARVEGALLCAQHALEAEISLLPTPKDEGSRIPTPA